MSGRSAVSTFGSPRGHPLDLGRERLVGVRRDGAPGSRPPTGCGRSRVPDRRLGAGVAADRCPSSLSSWAARRPPGASSKWSASLCFSQSRSRLWKLGSRRSCLHDPGVRASLRAVANLAPLDGHAEAGAGVGPRPPAPAGQHPLPGDVLPQEQAAGRAFEVAGGDGTPPGGGRRPRGCRSRPPGRRPRSVRPASAAISAMRIDASSPPHFDTRMLKASQRLRVDQRLRLGDRPQRLVDDDQSPGRRPSAAGAHRGRRRRPAARPR